MLLLVASFALTAFCFFVLTFRKKGEERDLMGKRFGQIKGNEDWRLDEELSKTFAQRFVIPAFLSVRRMIEKMKPKKAAHNDDKLEIELKQAGLSVTANEFITIEYFIVGSGIILAFILLISYSNRIAGLLMSIFIIALGILAPRYFLKMKVTMRKNKIRNQIPDVMDILCVSLEAGLGFDGAIQKISGRLKGPFVDELVILYREIKMGKPRREALRSLGERSNVEEVKTFASAVVQAETLGISVKNVLKLQAEQLRIARRELAEEKGKKAPIKMMIPLVVFVFPVIFIVLLGPTALQLMDNFK